MACRRVGVRLGIPGQYPESIPGSPGGVSSGPAGRLEACEKGESGGQEMVGDDDFGVLDVWPVMVILPLA
jgi:hypothetical protein